jgi:hypothetical protein
VRTRGCRQRINPCLSLLIVADPVATQASALRLSVPLTVCWLQIVLRGRLIHERFGSRTVSKRRGLPRRIEIARYCQDDHIQKRTLFKPNDCVVHPEAHELLSLLIDISKNPILFISFSVHHGPLVC